MGPYVDDIMELDESQFTELSNHIHDSVGALQTHLHNKFGDNFNCTWRCFDEEGAAAAESVAKGVDITVPITAIVVEAMVAAITLRAYFKALRVEGSRRSVKNAIKRFLAYVDEDSQNVLTYFSAEAYDDYVNMLNENNMIETGSNGKKPAGYTH